MELEERVGELERLARDHATELMAMNLLCRALIGSHPDAEGLGHVLQVLLKERIDRLRDVGFDRGYTPATAHGAAAELVRHTNIWIQLCGVEPEAG